MSQKFDLTIKQYNDFKAYKSAAFNDYLAARILLNNNNLTSGIVLANTAIEKYFKLFLVVQNPNQKSTTHSTHRLYKDIKKMAPDIAKKFNVGFIKLISNSYKIRYLEDLPKGYKLVISRRKILAELDYMVAELNSVWDFGIDTPYPTKYEMHVINKSEAIYKDNYLLNGISKKDFIEEHELDHYYQIENHPMLGIIELYYDMKTFDDNNFKLKGKRISVKEIIR